MVLRERLKPNVDLQFIEAHSMQAVRAIVSRGFHADLSVYFPDQPYQTADKALEPLVREDPIVLGVVRPGYTIAFDAKTQLPTVTINRMWLIRHESDSVKFFGLHLGDFAYIAGINAQLSRLKQTNPSLRLFGEQITSYPNNMDPKQVTLADVALNIFSHFSLNNKVSVQGVPF